MKPETNSPNGCYARHGYTVLRTPRKNGQGHHRKICDPTGRVVLDRAGYEAELAFCIENKLID